ncbi:MULTISPECIES: FecR domain-containing protein [Bosea]|jgi:transmembrane sensor|uniref:FecR family protein n=1 Tax=Bosea TaxID=85413 RepID=UPI00215057C9|nr:MULTISPECIES: FecR domain-containing protein [Bosea]MCR4522673.1 FecR domain-containing protein [Bosea sp. 47.2.35]MDR6827180.1 transmembrane sensor [Bosea robiniae]MDR6893890.1 transmembrane sensor [Bosea sp. BE109]MDR7136410.1 transmembrane sensor [Bosea sp. BE168]MDR7173109.1 transmembrane sensor [Bosea sp. BE271]
MRETEQDQDRLTDEAIDLVIRLQNDPANPVASEMMRSWRARSPAHERAWARVARLHGAAGKVLAEHGEGAGPSRRALLLGGVLGLGALGASYALLPEILLRNRADHATGKGETRQLTLGDGTKATLGPDSAIAVDYGEARRKVEVLTGMCFFEVARETSRPFMVTAGDLEATALGTAYDVSYEAGLAQVAVDRGTVQAAAAGLALPADLRLEAGDWMSFDASSNRLERGRLEAGQVATWRDRLIIAEKEAVSTLVARIGRWIPGRIVMADPFIGSQRVSGLFDLSDPVRALEAVVHPAGARVRQVSSFVTIISPL